VHRQTTDNRPLIDLVVGIVLQLLDRISALNRVDFVRPFDGICAGIVNSIAVSMNIPHVILLKGLKIGLDGQRPGAPSRCGTAESRAVS
jgi:hypothetical protein